MTFWNIHFLSIHHAYLPFLEDIINVQLLHAKRKSKQSNKMFQISDANVLRVFLLVFPVLPGTEKCEFKCKFQRLAVWPVG